METKISGVIRTILPEKSGVSQAGNPWRRVEIILETEESHAHKIAFSVMNARIDEFRLAVGERVELSVDVDSREFQGKWYTSLTAYRCTRI